MPELNWVGKDKVITHHLDVPFRVLDHQYSFDENGQHEADNGSENMIIHGDNLEALKALLPRYEGKVDCIYIDPPYNTGNEGWVYNDNVNDPRIKKWLGEVVGKEGEDLSRHDKWLCMMYPRLRLLGKLLSPKGVLIASLSIHELHFFLEVLNEIFSSRQVIPVTVQTSGGKTNKGFNHQSEFLIFVTPKEFVPNSYRSAKNTYASGYHGMNLAGFNQTNRPNQAYPIFVNEKGAIVGVGKSLKERVEDGSYDGDLANFEFDYDEAPSGSTAVWPVTAKGVPCVWRLQAKRLLKEWERGFIKVVPSKDKTKNIWAVQYLSDGILRKIESGDFVTYRISDDPEIPTLELKNYETSGSSIPTVWYEKEYFTTRGSELIREILGSKDAFTYPKPIDIVQEAIGRVTKPDSLVLDSFAGSGTTAHAVLNLNSEDQGNRKFILIELDDYAETVTAERIRKVIKGYEDVEGDLVPGTGGSYSFFSLGTTLFEGSDLNPEVPLDQIRAYIWHSETGIEAASNKVVEFPDFLGIHNDTSYIFAYELDRATVLDREYLSRIPAECGATSYVIYSDTCLLSEQELREMNITFKKIPRDITRL
ncbi:site-specific DNA-methyltransferase [Corynebacterium epidermidicanis]|uniref:Adenine specific DNA methylase Mod n=1 Tax=Corynebacterium epidermidicanis TaxID=1050174 RepID=A0A0G3GQZ7_9CORY|nr:site-specific DNA-methyltransferase [Corynebacterium epidermidicanis]AKK03000.1 adenine specific DNA methylase Mod [Corynebacterium epidermidicanis]